MCKTKLDKKEKVQKVDQSDSEMSTSECSKPDSEEDTQTDSTESINRIQEVSPQTLAQLVSEKLTVKAIRKKSDHRTRQLTRSGEEFQFTIKLNGRKIVAILDTGSPITILPRKYKTEVQPTRVLKPRRFVDVSGRPLQVNHRYKITTELNGTEQEFIW